MSLLERLRDRIRRRLDALGSPGPFGVDSEEIALGSRLLDLARLGEAAPQIGDPPNTDVGADLIALPGGPEGQTLGDVVRDLLTSVAGVGFRLHTDAEGVTSDPVTASTASPPTAIIPEMTDVVTPDRSTSLFLVLFACAFEHNADDSTVLVDIRADGTLLRPRLENNCGTGSGVNPNARRRITPFLLVPWEPADTDPHTIDVAWSTPFGGVVMARGLSRRLLVIELYRE